jgi:hypothetical protein
MYIMAVEAIKFNLFLILCIYLFSLFLYSHLKMTWAQLVSQSVMTEIKLLLRNTFSECCTDNLTNSFHMLMQRFVLFFHGGRPTDRQLIVSLFFPVLGVALTKWNFPNNRTHFVGYSAAVKNKTNLCVRIWKLFVRLTMRHSEKLLRYNNNLISVITRWENNCAPVIFKCEKKKKENK